MYIEGPLGSGKTRRLAAETLTLLENHPAESILVLCSNPSRQKRFSQLLLAGLKRAIGPLPVYTYLGFVRNTLFNFWPLAETPLKKSPGKAEIVPLLVGMEDSERLLRDIIKHMQQQQPEAFAEFSGSNSSLAKQLLRRLRLRAENGLSRPEMSRRSALLEEICQADVAQAEKLFDRLSYAMRVLDANKQLEVFHALLQNNAVLGQAFSQQIQHLIVDDVDETLPAQQAFIQFLAPTLQTLHLAADVDGGSRRGYLNAYPYDWQGLKALKPAETLSLSRQDEMAQNAQKLLNNWKQSNHEPLETLSEAVCLVDTAMTRVDMLDQVLEMLKTHLEAGYSAGDICITPPKADLLSLYPLLSRLRQANIPYQVVSGTKRPTDNPVCLAFLTALHLANVGSWGFSPSVIELKGLWIHGLKLGFLPPALLQKFSENLQRACQNRILNTNAPWSNFSDLLPIDLLENSGLFAEAPTFQLFKKRYQALLQWLQAAESLSFSKQLYTGFLQILTPYASPKDRFQDVKTIIESYHRALSIHERLLKTGLLPLAADNLFAHQQQQQFERLWLQQVKTGTVADTPDTPLQIDPQVVVIGTPQKLIDLELRRKIQLWLDVASREWSRSDDAPLYNAWVHSAVWDGSQAAFSEAFQAAVIRTRAAHITRGLMLLCTERVYAFCSELDDWGFVHNGLLKAQLKTLPSEKSGQSCLASIALLRPDQQPVLDYVKIDSHVSNNHVLKNNFDDLGSMAISAVPGAGKTFVNTQLILYLIEQGLPAPNILVLTYMDSAAKTLLGRLKLLLGSQQHQLPVVSTIHSLAYRIITENDHAVLLGYDPEALEILDEYSENQLLQQVAEKTLPEGEQARSWFDLLRTGIQFCKNRGITAETLNSQLPKPLPLELRKQSRFLEVFIKAYNIYQETLRKNGQLDFTELILRAIELLEKFSDIRTVYQNRFTVIIEDEAQDSSKLLQRLIALLGKTDSPNIVRTGDTNQSITTTFSAADASVFRSFIHTAQKKVLMNYSSRCAPEIIDLANFWINAASQQENLKQAFEPVCMQPVPEKNPTLLRLITAKQHETDDAETEDIITTIKALQAIHPEAEIAVLTRTNPQAKQISRQLQQANISAICRSQTEQLNHHRVFSTLLAMLQWLEAPGDLSRQEALFERFAEANLTEALSEGLSDRLNILQNQAILYATPIQAMQWQDPFLLQLYYDGLEFLQDASTKELCPLIIRMTDRLFSSVEDRSNGYLCALMADQILRAMLPDIELEHLSPLEYLIQQFTSLQRAYHGSRGFSGLSETGKTGSPFVQVMTLHKAKGQEFDVVFMPSLQQEHFADTPEKVRFKEGDKLTVCLEYILTQTDKQPKTALQKDLASQFTQLKQARQQANIEEEARLIYVGLTRAKRALFLSAYQKYLSRYGRWQNSQPTWAFQVLQEHLTKTTHTETKMELSV